MSRKKLTKKSIVSLSDQWFKEWLPESGLSRKHRGNIAAVLIVMQRLVDDTNIRGALSEIFAEVKRDEWRGWLALRLFVTPNEGQIAGISGGALARILAKQSVYGGYLGTDAGRTSRGNFRPVRLLLEHLPEELALAKIHRVDFERVVNEMQRRIVEELVVPELEPDPIKVDVSRYENVSQVVDEILRQARSRNLTGCVAQHLLAVKLARVHGPEQVMGFDKPCSAKDKMAKVELSRDGDFRVGDTAFHVTVSPKRALLQRFAENRAQGLSAKLLVLNKDVLAAEEMLQDPNVEVNGLQTYISQNTSEWGGELRNKKMTELGKLIEQYNDHVIALERRNSGMEIELTGA